jgi:hypothetical protein
MRDYSKITSQFWTGATGRKLRGDKVAQIIAVGLLTSLQRNMLGLYYLPIAFIAHELGLTLKEAIKGLRKCIEAEFCGYDFDAEVVWVYNMAAFQIDEKLVDGDKRVKWVQNIYNSLPANCFLEAFYGKYSQSFKMSNPRKSISPIEAPSKLLQVAVEALPKPLQDAIEAPSMPLQGIIESQSKALKSPCEANPISISSQYLSQDALAKSSAPLAVIAGQKMGDEKAVKTQALPDAYPEPEAPPKDRDPLRDFLFDSFRSKVPEYASPAKENTNLCRLASAISRKASADNLEPAVAALGLLDIFWRLHESGKPYYSAFTPSKMLSCLEDLWPEYRKADALADTSWVESGEPA